MSEWDDRTSYMHGIALTMNSLIQCMSISSNDCPKLRGKELQLLEVGLEFWVHDPPFIFIDRETIPCNPVIKIGGCRETG